VDRGRIGLEFRDDPVTGSEDASSGGPIRHVKYHAIPLVVRYPSVDEAGLVCHSIAEAASEPAADRGLHTFPLRDAGHDEFEAVLNLDLAAAHHGDWVGREGRHGDSGGAENVIDVVVIGESEVRALARE
jgi:hypothetical protein